MDYSHTPQQDVETRLSTGDSVNTEVSQISQEDDVTRIGISLPTGAYFLSGIRDFTLEMVRNMTGFTEQWAFRFQSIVDELVNNAIEHGSQQGNEVRITFAHKKGEWLDIIVEDSGTGTKRKNAQEMTEYLRERKNIDFIHYKELRGRGLAQIVAAWTDELHFEDIPSGGLRVIARKYLSEQYTHLIKKEETTSQTLLTS